MSYAKKLWKPVLLCGLVLLTSCRDGPQIDECLLTIHDCDAGNRCLVLNDCRRPDGTFFERNGMLSDGAYNITARDRATLLNWVKANCDYEQE